MAEVYALRLRVGREFDIQICILVSGVVVSWGWFFAASCCDEQEYECDDRKDVMFHDMFYMQDNKGMLKIWFLSKKSVNSRREILRISNREKY